MTPPDPAGREAARPAAGGGRSIVQLVRSDGFAGVERYMCQVSNALVRRGNRVAVIGGDPARMTAELAPEVRHTPASSVARAAGALIGHRGADIVHAHMTAAETAAWLARPVQRAPIVATRHFADDRGSSAAARLVARLATRSLSLDIAISQFVASSITGPSVLLHNGVPDRDQAPLEAPTVVMLQRLTGEKAPQLGIRAWAESGLGAGGWHLVVAGVGDLRSGLEEMARDLGVGQSVEFVGQIADTDQLLGRASVLLAPAPAEPFGLSVVEAMAHGVPVVAAHGGAHIETLGDDGVLFPRGDASAAGRALAELAASPSRRRSVGAALRARQRRQFTLEGHVDRLEGLYDQVIAGHRAAGR